MSDNLSFSKAYQELESLTTEFEQGNLDLEKAIPKFKRAAELAKFLKSRLKQLETQIEEINVGLEKEMTNVSDPASDNGSSDIEF